MVSGGFYPKIGGTERQAERLAVALKRLGFEVRILTLRFRDDLPLDEEIGGLRVVRIPYPKIKVVGRVVILLRLAWRLFSDRRRYDLVHVHMAEYMAFVSILVARPLGKTVILKFAVRPPDSAGVFGDFPEFVARRRFLEQLLFFVIRKADCFVAISEMISEMAIKRGIPPERVVRIPNGVDIGTFHPVTPPEREDLRRSLAFHPGLAVVFIGRLIPRKGVADLLGAWRTVSAKRNDVTLYILGTGRSEEEFLAKARDLGLRDSVKFRGSVNNVVAYLQSADLFVLPSHYEGMPNVLLEAMACGLPVVATRVSGVVDIVRDGRNGLLVEPGRPDGLAEAILRLLDDPAEAARLGKAAHETIEKEYSIEAVAGAYAALYQSLLKERQHAKEK
jgi:glycosyltransferase involved in cell wall biosynthesis